MINYSIPLTEYKIEIRDRNYKRQDISSLLAYKNTGHAVKGCMRAVVGGSVKLLLNRHNNNAHYSGLLTCGSVWDCPVCSSKIAYKRAVEIRDAVTNWSDLGNSVFMVTYTIRHNLGDSLADLSDAMTNAIRFVHSGAPYQRIKAHYKIRGGITSTEVLFNPYTGWHYHKHQLIFVEGKLKSLHSLENWIFTRYTSFLTGLKFDACRGIGVKITSNFDNNDIVANYISKWGVEKELTRNDIKSNVGMNPFELLDDSRYHKRFLEYSVTMKGRRKLTWSVGLRKMCGLVDLEFDDSMLAVETMLDGEETIHNFEYKEWQNVVKRKMRADLLAWAESGSFYNNYRNTFAVVAPGALDGVCRDDWANLRSELIQLRDNGMCSAPPYLMGVLVKSGYFLNPHAINPLIEYLSN